MAGGKPTQMFQALLLGPWMSEKGGRKMGALSAKTNQKDLLTIKELLEAGKIVSVIDDCYPLSKTAEAFRYFEKRTPKGKWLSLWNGITLLTQCRSPEGHRDDVSGATLAPHASAGENLYDSLRDPSLSLRESD